MNTPESRPDFSASGSRWETNDSSIEEGLSSRKDHQLMNSLKKRFFVELANCYDAEQRLVTAMPKLLIAAK